MKKSFAIAALPFVAIALGTNNVQAQNHTATTKATINLSDVISLDADPTSSTVAFNYESAAHYNQSQTVTQAKALKVTSTKNFDINVKVGGASFKNGSNEIPVNVLTIVAKPVPNGMNGAPKSVVLEADKDLPLIVGSDKGSALTVDLEYTIPAERSSSADILGKPAGTYTQTVIYTASTL